MRTMRSGADSDENHSPSILYLPSNSKKSRTPKQDGERVKFLTELYSILNDPTQQFTQYISWNNLGNLLIIHDEISFFQNVIKIRFPKQTKLDSFNRQMRDWGFQRLSVNEKRLLNYSDNLRVFKHQTLTAASTSDEIRLVPYKKMDSRKKEPQIKKTKKAKKVKASETTVEISRSQPIPLKIPTPQLSPLLSPRPQIPSNSTHSTISQLLNIVEDDVVSNKDFFSRNSIEPVAPQLVPVVSNRQHRQPIDFDFGSMTFDPWMVVIDSSDTSMKDIPYESAPSVDQMFSRKQPYDSYTTPPPPSSTSNSSPLTDSPSVRASPNPFTQLSPASSQRELMDVALEVSAERSTSTEYDCHGRIDGNERFSERSRNYIGTKLIGLQKRPSELVSRRFILYQLQLI